MMWSHLVFFVRQKTAYDMRISDWSSDVSSSDLVAGRRSPREVGDGACIHPYLLGDMGEHACQGTTRAAAPPETSRGRSASSGPGGARRLLHAAHVFRERSACRRVGHEYFSPFSSSRSPYL